MIHRKSDKTIAVIDVETADLNPNVMCISKSKNVTDNKFVLTKLS